MREESRAFEENEGLRIYDDEEIFRENVGSKTG